MPPSLPYQTPMARPGRRQVSPGTSFVTVSSAVDIATESSFDPTGSTLSLDDQDAGGTPEPGDFSSTQPFAGVGGTLTETSTTILSSAATSTTLPSTPASSLRSSQSKPISLTAVIAVFVTVPILCALLIGSVCWKRRRNRSKMVAARRERRLQRERDMSIVGLHGFSRMVESSTDDLKSDFSSHAAHSLPSPATIKYAFLQKPEQHAMHNIPTSGVKASTNKSRRVSTKSTMTGKINPSNNFAAPSHDESHEDAWGTSAEDARSLHSRHPLSPTSPNGFHLMPSPLASLSASAASGELTGEPSSFLTFMSGDVELDEPRLSTVAPGLVLRSGSPLKEGPTVQSTPTPKRALTQRSHKGGVPDQMANVPLPTLPQNHSAMDNLIAALDHPPERRDSAISLYPPYVDARSLPDSHTPSPFTDIP